MKIRVLNNEGDEILSVDGTVRIPSSDDDWSLSLSPSPQGAVFVKSGKTTLPLLQGTWGLQVPKRFRRLHVGRLDLFNDYDCRRPIGSIHVAPLRLNDADFIFLLRDLRRIAIDMNSPFRANFALEHGETYRENSLAYLEGFLTQYLSGIHGLIESFEADLEASIDVMSPHHAVRRMPAHSYVIQELKTSQTIRALLRRPADTGPKLRYLAALTTEVVLFTESIVAEKESLLRSQADRMVASRTHLTAINKAIAALTVYTKNTQGQLTSPTNEILLDERVLRVRNLWRDFKKNWSQLNYPDCPVLETDPFDNADAIQDLGIAKSSTLYERWFALVFFNGLRDRGFQLSHGSTSPFDMYEFVDTPQGLEMTIRRDRRDFPIRLVKNSKDGDLLLSMWIEPWIKRRESGQGFRLLTRPESKAKTPDLLVKVEFRGKVHWAVLDCKFLATDTVDSESKNLRRKYLRELGADSCWMIHPLGDVLNNWSLVRNPEEYMSQEMYRRWASVQVHRAVFKVSPATASRLALFYFQFFDGTRTETRICWGCGGEREEAEFNPKVYYCSKCEIGWIMDNCPACRSPFISSLRGQQFQTMNAKAYRDRYHFCCPCGSRGRFLNTQEVGQRISDVERTMQSLEFGRR